MNQSLLVHVHIHVPGCIHWWRHLASYVYKYVCNMTYVTHPFQVPIVPMITIYIPGIASALTTGYWIMGPKKCSHRVIDIDEYTPVQPNRRVSQHSSYEIQGRPTHSFIAVPAATVTPTVSPDSLIPPTIPDINHDKPFEDDEYSNRKEGFREMEAMGFSSTLTQSDEAIDSLETWKRQRSQAVGRYLF